MYLMLEIVSVAMCRARCSSSLNGKICTHISILRCEHRLHVLMGRKRMGSLLVTPSGKFLPDGISHGPG